MGGILAYLTIKRRELILQILTPLEKNEEHKFLKKKRKRK